MAAVLEDPQSERPHEEGSSPAAEFGGSEEHHKDACKYSADVSKQFLTLASAGVAIVTGIASSGTLRLPVYLGFASFVVSVLFGLLYVMAIVGHVNSSKNYNVYSPALRRFALVQILAFFLGILFLVPIINQRMQSQAGAPSTQAPDEAASMILKVGEVSLKNNVEPGQTLKIQVDKNGKLEVEFKGADSPSPGAGDPP